MEQKNYLGLYISKASATAVCIDSQSKDTGVVGSFSVHPEDPAEASVHALANLISQGCAERAWEFSEVFVALDCAMFMQHNVHSEFSDARQIGATIRFDTEEALAMDVSDVAIAFQITSENQNGSDLTVFTAKKQMLSEILISLQSGGMDPVTVEPDVNSLSRYICRKVLDESGESGTLFGLLSSRSGYLIAPHTNGSAERNACRVRTFLVGSKTNRNSLLTREVMMTTALAGGEAIDRFRVFDSAGVVDCEQLAERLGIEAGEVDLLTSTVDEEVLADCAEVVDFAIAYGAAMGHLEKAPAVNFRDDFMPYQGKKLRLQKALKFFSVSLTILLVATGLYFQTRLFSVNKYRDKVRKKFAADYATVMLDQKLPEGMSIRKAVSDLGKVRRQVAKTNPLVGGDADSIPSQLALVLGAFNKSAAQTKLELKSVTIGSRGIVVSGSTANANMLFTTIKGSGLNIIKESLDTDPATRRAIFNITIVPRRK